MSKSLPKYDFIVTGYRINDGRASELLYQSRHIGEASKNTEVLAWILRMKTRKHLAMLVEIEDLVTGEKTSIRSTDSCVKDYVRPPRVNKSTV